MLIEYFVSLLVLLFLHFLPGTGRWSGQNEEEMVLVISNSPYSGGKVKLVKR